MADIFISYSKKHARLTEELARDLEAEGYTTWWDTSLLPGDEFPDEIKRQLDAAKAVIVIWTESSVNSKWVRAEATRAYAQNKLLALHEAGLDLQEIPLPFNTLHSELAIERARIFVALERRAIVPSKAPGPEPAKLPPGAREMVVVPAGSFTMGSKDGEGQDNEGPQHTVTIPQAFAVGKYPVTFADWDTALAAGGVKRKPNDYGWGRGRRPVIDVSWDDAQAYIKWLSGATGQSYRLLSEAEWEYACRAGTAAAYSFGDGIGDLGRYAWYSANSGGKTHPVGEKAANDFGLHDMHGNIWEWCEDAWHDSYKRKPENLKITGAAWTTEGDGFRVLRGGSWDYDPQYLRAAYRGIYVYPVSRGIDVGFRVAKTLSL